MMFFTDSASGRACAVRMDAAVDQHPPRLVAAAHRDPEGVSEADVVHPHFDVPLAITHPPGRWYEGLRR